MSKTFDSIPAQPTVLLAERPYMPYGDVVLFYGDGSIGKGRMLISIVASTTRGRPVGYDSAGEPPGDVWLLLPEDKEGEQVRPRLDAAHADTRRVHNLTRKDGGERFKFSANPKTEGDIAVLRAEIMVARRSCLCGFEAKDSAELAVHLKAHASTPDSWKHAARNPRLVVCDPVTALVGDGTIQTNKGARTFVERLQDLAEDTGVCIALVAHPTKSGDLQGSRALRDALRVVYYIAWQDKASSDVRVVTLEKGNNVSPEQAEPLKFAIRGEQARVVWLLPAKQAPQGEPWRARRQAEIAAYRAPKPAPAPEAAKPAATAPAPSVPPQAGSPVTDNRRWRRPRSLVTSKG